ncbi:hypothetical protein pipiens_015369, partial [Culex pipiens pipiens]
MYDEYEERDRFRPLAFDQEETKSCFTEYSMSSSVIWRNELCTKWRSINPKPALPMNVLGATVRVKSPGPNGRSKKLLKEYRVERRIERKVNTLTVKDEEKQQEKRQLNSRVNAGPSEGSFASIVTNGTAALPLPTPTMVVLNKPGGSQETGTGGMEATLRINRPLVRRRQSNSLQLKLFLIRRAWEIGRRMEALRTGPWVGLMRMLGSWAGRSLR